MFNQNIKAYIIYNPAYRRIKKYVKLCGYRNYIVNTWNICLDKADSNFDLKLVWVKTENQSLIQFLDKLAHLSNSYHFWDKSPSISINKNYITELEEFISTHKLWKFIEKVQTKAQLSIILVTVKVITFHPRVSVRNILMTFDLPLYIEHRKSLIFAEAYEWLSPSGLNHFKKKIQYPYTHVVIYLLLDYYRMCRRRRNIRVLNLFDLCALRLALFDPRYYQFDQCEIPKLIHTELCEIVKRRTQLDPTYKFRPTLYLIEHGIQSVPSTVAEYFIVCASDYSEFVSKRELVKINFSYEVDVDEYVQLYGAKLYDDFLIDFIQNRPFLEICVTSQNQVMSSKVLGSIIKFPNVYSADFNISLPVELEPFCVEDFPMIEKSILLELYSAGELNFLQHYIEWLKPACKCRKINLIIRCTVINFSIFNDLNVEEIIFVDQEINKKMLTELKRSETSTTRYIWERAYLEEHTHVLRTLHEHKLVNELQLTIEENTFESVFNFIESMFRENDLSEMAFGGDLVAFNIIIPIDGCRTLDLSEYTFKLNSERIKIEMFENSSKNIVDLYDILFETATSTYDDVYDFYQ